jgi:cytochrome c oxidase assembly protein subunit 15
MDSTSLFNLAPAAQIALLGIGVALPPLAWIGWRQRGADGSGRRRALTLLILFLSFDLVLFGAFTRLSDSGLGCPDWPGCYGSASPLGAHEQISSAQSALPSGPVTHRKAWIEMIHRYLAAGVGVLITLAMVLAWRARKSDPQAPWWATLSFVWVCVVGAFGALTVTLKLYPAIVTLHLLGGLALLALLAVQTGLHRRGTIDAGPGLRTAVLAVALLALVQIALGGWVSTNYAVLACGGFPSCQGQWWPGGMDFEQGFSILRPLGVARGGEGYLPFGALVAIHLAHRLGALVVLTAMVGLGALLWRHGGPARRFALGLWAIALWQTASGISNVALGWPLAAALAHTGGAAALVILLATLWVRLLPLKDNHALAVQPRLAPTS